MTGPALARLDASAVARARLPLPMLGSAAAAISLVAGLSILRPTDEVPLFVVHLAVVLLAAGAAYLLDDPAKQVTEVVPQSLWRRRAGIVLRGYGVIAGAWVVVMVLLQWRSPSAPLVALTWEAAGLSCLAVAASGAVARRGETEPGNLVSPAMALMVVGALITQPMLHVTLLVAAGDGPDRGGWWAGAIAGAAVTFVIASRDRAAGRLMRR